MKMPMPNPLSNPARKPLGGLSHDEWLRQWDLLKTELEEATEIGEMREIKGKLLDLAARAPSLNK